MKTLKRVNKKNKSAILLGSILSMMLSITPLHGSEKPGKDGENIDEEEWMTLPFEVLNADYNAELEIEEWMTLPFEVLNSDYEAELEIEEWMTLPFEVLNYDYEAELEIEEWMTVAWI